MKFDPSRIQGIVDAQADQREATRIQEAIESRFDDSLEGLFRAFPFLEEINTDFQAAASELEGVSPEDATVARDAVKVKLIEAKQSFEELIQLTMVPDPTGPGSALEHKQFKNFGELADSLNMRPEAAEYLDKLHASSDFIELTTVEIRRELSSREQEYKMQASAGRPY